MRFLTFLIILAVLIVGCGQKPEIVPATYTVVQASPTATSSLSTAETKDESTVNLPIVVLEASSTPVQSTTTAIPATVTAIPATMTDIPPSATAIPATATTIPPSATAFLATETAIPATETAIPATSEPTQAAAEVTDESQSSENQENEENDDGVEVMALRDDLPAMGYQDWPRPGGDNGRCMHWSHDQYFSEEYLNTNLPRLQLLGAKWVLVVYGDENIIKMSAPRFAEAGIIPIWRKMVRANQSYYDWERDIKLVQSYGLPPYFQLYNEPSLGVEWRGDDPNVEEFLDHLIQASRDVYNLGGYVGWQFINNYWLDRAIDEVQRRQGSKLFERFFFIPHPYGMNLPPDWTEDGRGVLSFRPFAEQLKNRLGFYPMMIAGEGGWRITGQDEPRFPRMDDETHARYHVELFDWFRTGIVSDGQPLPDYFFAYCVWLISSKGDDNAWWDSFAGNRDLTIQSVSSMPPFERRFSWQR